MRLKLLAEAAGVSGGIMDTEVLGIAYDSRRVRQGDLFIALRGGAYDGHAFINDAIERGASAVVHEGTLALSVPGVPVESSRRAMALISNAFYGYPSRTLNVIGVTGTNGKTTTTRMIKSIIDHAGGEAGLIGTIDYEIKDEVMPAPHTTPEAPEFQGLLARMRDAGCTHAVTEVSSHALMQSRVEGTEFKVSVFTNLTPEHLDFHHTMGEYFDAKARLFTELLGGAAVINIDDPYGLKLAGMLKNVITYGIKESADLTATGLRMDARGSSMTLRYKGIERPVTVPIPGIVNVYNALAATGAALGLGMTLDDAASGLARMPQVAGRFERVEAGQKFLCVVDYAHTEDALERLLRTVREITASRVITVFGCGGDRDRTKRPRMGAVATSLSEITIITSDNPRSEEPLAIISGIIEGVTAGSRYMAVADRAEAIRDAIAIAAAGDSVVIAGKGHEEYQEIKGVRYAFSDREAARRAIEEITGNRR